MSESRSAGTLAARPPAARRLGRGASLGSVVAVAALGGAAPGAHAAELCVSASARCHATVQAAVDAAHDGDVIRIGRGTFAGGAAVARSVRLIGAGAGRTVIRGGGPVLTLGGPSSTPTVTIAGLTVTGGLARTNPRGNVCGGDVPTCGPGYPSVTALGAGIEAFPGTTVTILRSVVAGNRSVPTGTVDSVLAVCPGGPCPVSFGDAAGIDNWGTMTLVGTVVRDNHASGIQSNGGGIADEAGGTLTLRDSVVSGNSVSAVPPSGRFASGGGILVAGGATLTVEHSRIDGNSAGLDTRIPHPFPQQGGGTDQNNAQGGGIFLADGSTARIHDSTLNANRVTVRARLGEPFGGSAALCACGDVDLLVTDTAMDRNLLSVDVLSTADSGPSGPGALEIDLSGTVERAHITGNLSRVRSATGDAGAFGAVAVFNSGERTATFRDGTITANTSTATALHGAATIQGAGITNNGTTALQGVVVRRNRGRATGATGFAHGGGIHNVGVFDLKSSLSLVDSSVSANRLSASAGLEVLGGGVFTPGAPLTSTNSRVAGNVPDDCAGC